MGRLTKARKEKASAAEYIEENYNQLKERFFDFEWLKVYLEETVQTELDLVDAFFSAGIAAVFIGRIYKGDCINAMTHTLRTALNHQGAAKSLSVLLIETKKTDEQDLSVCTLGDFLIPDLIKIAIDYSFRTQFEVGMYIDLLDTVDIWDIVEVKRILQYKNNIYMVVHYLEWTDHYDEFITVNSSRIRFFCDDNNHAVYNWTRVDKQEATQVDCRIRGESKWMRSTVAQTSRYNKISLAPAGTFLKDNR